MKQTFDFINQVATVLDIPSKIIGFFGLLATLLAYVSGRRSRLLGESAGSTNDAMLAEVRQGFQSMAAALSALSAAQPGARPGGIAPSVSPLSPVPVTPGAPPVSASVPASPLPAAPYQPRMSVSPPAAAPKRWVRYRALAITSAAGLLMTLCYVGFFVMSAQSADTAQLADNSAFGFFAATGFLGLIVTLVALVWACVKAIRINRIGWAIALFLGTIGLTFFSALTLPGLLILIFAIWGPEGPPARHGPQPAVAAPRRGRT